MAERIISLIGREAPCAKGCIRRPHPGRVIGGMYYACDRDRSDTSSIGHFLADHDRDTWRRSNEDAGFDLGTNRNYHVNVERSDASFA